MRSVKLVVRTWGLTVAAVALDSTAKPGTSPDDLGFGERVPRVNASAGGAIFLTTVRNCGIAAIAASPWVGREPREIASALDIMQRHEARANQFTLQGIDA